MSVSLFFLSFSYWWQLLLVWKGIIIWGSEEGKREALVGERGHHPFPYLEKSMALMGACHVYLLLSEEKLVVKKAWARKFMAFQFLLFFFLFVFLKITFFFLVYLKSDKGMMLANHGRIFNLCTVVISQETAGGTLDVKARNFSSSF